MANCHERSRPSTISTVCMYIGQGKLEKEHEIFEQAEREVSVDNHLQEFCPTCKHFFPEPVNVAITL